VRTSRFLSVNAGLCTVRPRCGSEVGPAVRIRFAPPKSRRTLGPTRDERPEWYRRNFIHLLLALTEGSKHHRLPISLAEWVGVEARHFEPPGELRTGNITPLLCQWV
jgi:hypothetical protein